jgi:NACalpha-BTF3-like transcription factor
MPAVPAWTDGYAGAWRAHKAASKASAPKSSGASSNEAPLSEEGLTVSHIDMVMDHTSCTRNEAIKALRESNNDMINAVMKLTN